MFLVEHKERVLERGRKEGEGPGIKYFDSQTSSKFNNFHHQTQGIQRVKRGGQVLPAEFCLWLCYQPARQSGHKKKKFACSPVYVTALLGSWLGMNEYIKLKKNCDGVYIT